MPPLARLSGRNQYAPSTERHQYGVFSGMGQLLRKVHNSGIMDAPAPAPRAAKFSIPSIIALVCAILSFTTGAILGLILACVAIFFGLLGVVLSFSSRTRGGIVSTFSLLAGIIGIIAAVIKAVRWLV